MAQIASVAAITGTGKAFAVNEQGVSRELKAGDVLQKGETIRTVGDVRVELLMDDGRLMAVAPNQVLRLDENVSESDQRPTAQDSAVGAPAGTADTILQALERGTDLSTELEATAAGLGGGGGADGGSTFVQLLRITEGVDPLSFNYSFEAQDLPPDIQAVPEIVLPATETVQPTLTIKIFAVELVGEGTEEYKLVDGPIAEGTTATYVALAVDADGVPLANQPAGTVNITFEQGSAVAGEDYSAQNVQVELGRTFTADVLDDYLTDNGESFDIRVDGFSDEASYSGISYIGTATVILDDSNPGTPETPDEPDAETVTVQVFAVVGYGENGTPILAPVNSVDEGANATYVTYAVDPAGNIITGATGDVTITFTNGTAGSADYVNASQSVALGETFTATALDDYLADNAETFTVAASGYTNAAAYEDVVYGDAVTTTITDESDPGTPDTIYAEISVDLSTVAEGGVLTYTVKLVDSTGASVTVPAGSSVDVALAWTGAAANASDADPLPTSITIDGGTSETKFEVAAQDDYFAEDSEPLVATIDDVTDTDGVYEAVAPSATNAVASSEITDDDVLPSITDANVSVSEEGLIAGLADADPLTPEDADTTDLATRTGTINITGNGTAPLSVAFGLLASMPDALGETTVTWHYGLLEDGVTENQAVLIANDGEQDVLRITLNGGGTIVNQEGATPPTTVGYEVELLAALDHTGNSTEDTFTFSIGILLSDGVNDPAEGSLEVTVEDDMPVAVQTDVQSLSVALVDGSDTGLLGIKIGADVSGGQVTLTYESGGPLSSGGVALHFYSDADTGGLYAATAQDSNPVLTIAPSVDVNGEVSYTVNVIGLIDQNTVTTSTGISLTVVEFGVEIKELVGNFESGTLKAGNYKPDAEPVGGTINSVELDENGAPVGTMKFWFEGYEDSDNKTDEFVFGTEVPVSVSGQNVGVASNMISNSSKDDDGTNANKGDGDGQLLVINFSKTVTSLSMLFDQLDNGETAHYSINGGATWIDVAGTGTGGSTSSDEKIEIINSAGFTELLIRGSEDSQFGILTNTIVAEWQEEVPTETPRNFNVKVLDVDGEDQTLSFAAQATDGDGDLSGLVNFDVTLDDGIDYSAAQVEGSTVSGFSVAEGDTLDFRDIFGDMDKTADQLVTEGYLKVSEVENGTATIAVDLDTSGTAYQMTTVMTLTGLDSSTTAESLLTRIVTNPPVVD